MKKKITIIAGDPNSINSELIFKSWKSLNIETRKRIILIGNCNLIYKQQKKLKFNINVSKISNIYEDESINKLKVLDIPLKFNDCFNVSRKEASKYVVNCLNYAHKLCVQKKINAFINCPIDKNLIKKKGIHGVTEFLGKKHSSTKFTEVMFLHNKKFSVVPVTTHLKIKDISTNIKEKLIIKKVKTILFYYKKLFNKKPKIAVLGLNPHNSELEKNSEEVKNIIPAIKKLKKYGFIKGPMVADSFFKDDYKKYDVIVGMYHDQVLIPFKNLFKFNAINITLGLDYIRISPDHGTAKDIICKNKGDPKSLIESIKFLNKLK
jgi:4-hydroxy-L-threonine phosphate dehydrogenase PdxA